MKKDWSLNQDLKGKTPGHLKSQEKNVLRREKEQEGESLLYSRNSQMCMGSMAWRAEQRVQEIKGEWGSGPDATSFYKQR